MTDLASLSTDLARFALTTRSAAIPADVKANAWLHLIDAYGIGILASTLEYGDALARFVAAQPVGDVATVWGHGRKASLRDAALANGTMTGALNYDDTHNESQLHPGAHLVPLALALGEAFDLSGAAVIDALALGNEVGCRLACVAPGAFIMRGFHTSSVLGKIYAAIMAARLLELPLRETVDAVGHAASQAGGLMQCYLDGSWTLAFHHGWTAAAAIDATAIARAGFRGPVQALDGPLGLFAGFVAGTGKTPDYARATAALGDHWENRAMSLKPFATGCVIHPFIDASLRLVREHRLDWRDVKRVTLPIADYLVPVVCEPLAEKRRPHDVFNARVSLHYLIAETLYFGRFDIHSVRPESLRDPDLLGLVDRVDYVLDPAPAERQHFRGWVRIERTDGTVLECKLDPWRRMHIGEADTQAEVEQKFCENVGERAGAAGARDILALAQGLESGGRVRGFITDSHARIRIG